MSGASSLQPASGALRSRHPGLAGNLPLWSGGVLLAAIALASLFAPLLSPYGPNDIDLRAVRLPPSADHWLGTDAVGRDLGTRVLYGGRTSLIVAGVGMIGSLTVGSFMGMLGALGSRPVRWAVERAIDIQLAFPYVLLGVAITSVIKPSVPVLILLMVLAAWAGAARIVRAIAMQERGKDYVKAAGVLGASKVRIALRHIFPSVVPSLIVLAAMQMAAMIVFEATLSFLGMGVQPPTPSWGGIMLDGKNYMTSSWWLTVLPGLAIVLTSLSLILIGDGLERRRNSARAGESEE
ncbi:ABC transporter permease [Oceanibium sediminis]|uniref:ABC transporter permease n=1 Tax=Oceanibium sediminis TaxID=2026339 RepID=UPI000DD38FC1|nr:ABC transporter permease [Oceanibium sediminis]